MALKLDAFIFFLFIIIVASSGAAIQNKYCQLVCDHVVINYTHTVCDRQAERCGPDPRCGPDFKVIKLTDNHRQYIVDLHNYFRNTVAMGNETRGKQPSAANMNILTYNRELEFTAQCWANTCNGNPLIHDKCRRTAQHEHVGQNLGFINSSLSTINLHTSIRELSLLWYNEVTLFNKAWVNDTRDRGPNHKVGHYTQMLWADSSEIGCAATYYTSKPAGQKWHYIVFICNYGPGGNYLGAPMYDVGKPSSKCSNGLKPNKHYKGLCGNFKRVTSAKKKYDIFDY